MKRIVPPTSFRTTLTPGTAAAGELRQVAPKDLNVLANLNLRVEGTEEFEAGIGELAMSIVENGFYPDKPLAGYVNAADQVIVIDGHRRLVAVNKINSESLDGEVVSSVPVIIKPETDSMMDLTIAMIQSASGVPLSEFEKGIGCKRLIADGMTKEDVAKRLGASVKTVENYLLVASLPAKGRDLLLDGKVRFTHALKAMRKPETAVATLQSMVKVATDKGRVTARQSDTPAPQVEAASGDLEQVTIEEALPPVLDPVTIQVVKDGDMGAVVRQIAVAVRDRVPHDTGEGDLVHVNGVITITVTLEPQVEAFSPKRVRKAKPAPVVVEPDTDL